MASPRKFNWADMGTSPAEVLSARLIPGAGSVPDGIDWAMSPQGARFWYSVFVHGDGRGTLAIARMLRQAEKDLEPYFPPVYNIALCAPTVAHILRVADWLREARGVPYSGINWHATPQGYAFWQAYFASVDRDPRVIDDFIAAAKRFAKLERK